MRGLREHPRITIAKTLGAISLILIGVAIGAAGVGGKGERMQATEARLVSARHSIAARETDLRLAHTRAQQLDAALDRAEHRLQAVTRTNRQLRQDLRRATRARKQRKRPK